MDLIDRERLKEAAASKMRIFATAEENWYALADAIDEAPTAVELVYCKDCKHLRDGLYCTQHHFSDGGEETILRLIQDKMFCALGEPADE